MMYYREEETTTQEGVRALKVYLSTLIEKEANDSEHQEILSIVYHKNILVWSKPK